MSRTSKLKIKVKQAMYKALRWAKSAVRQSIGKKVNQPT